MLSKGNEVRSIGLNAYMSCWMDRIAREYVRSSSIAILVGDLGLTVASIVL